MIDGTHIALGLAIVSGVIWAIRLEAKANQANKDLSILQEAFFSHQTDRSIHHNADAFAEFEKRIDLRFAHLSESVEKVEKYIEDIDRKIERYMRED